MNILSWISGGRSATRNNHLVDTKKRIYLDHAASTPMWPEVFEAMRPYFLTTFGNASSVHSEGREVSEAVEKARATIAKVLGIQSTGVVFTSGGTESNNLAIRGVVERKLAGGVSYAQMEIVTTKIEHPATYKTLEALKRQGVTIKYVAVDESGYVKLEELRSLLSDQTILVCVTYVNSEIGTIEKISQIKRLLQKEKNGAYLFVDAAQAPLWVNCDMPRLQADLIAFDGGKCGGPQGVGVLAFRKGVELLPYVEGGGQENGLRSGTEPTALLVGMATAFALAQSGLEERVERIKLVRDAGVRKILETIPEAILNGASLDERVANNINISIPGINSEYAVIVLDTHGVSVSTKSACGSAGGGESAVVLATTGDPARASSTLRITLGPDSTLSEIETTAKILKENLDKLTF